jgi:hypothetical protein
MPTPEKRPFSAVAPIAAASHGLLQAPRHSAGKTTASQTAFMDAPIDHGSVIDGKLITNP